ncbi:hypothetical protein NA56DRAFT_649149 [Hyaloscypha hepaticicola]|uniref:Uncharacterized protein n=1 Tax=Hyaloscypha hepaticicola TaxID=2082293 RepID=A0A2J6PS62_9HELO|nr:hypothetical protein NA56DRAFT_649149 [Hyaloscypha hepaticicola]
MSPLARSPILSALARTRIQRPAIQQFRTYAAVRTASAGAAAGPGWAAQWKKIGGSAMMYFPVVAVVMFWPYAVPPIMELVEDKW